jgi:xanthine dehydrogenase YagR molybdenum-binding subunit
MAATTSSPAESIIGKAVPRIDGPLKTSGTAKYSSDHNFPNLAFAVPVSSTIGKGRIRRLDSSAAASMPGVIRVYSYGKVPPIYRPIPHVRGARIDEQRPPFEDENIYYNGQYVALVVAESFEQAKAAARAVKVEYESQTPNVALDLGDGFTDKMHEESKRGDVDKAFASAPVKIDETYVTPVETHNPIELHASVATWDGSRLVLYETTQAVMNHQAVMAQMLGVPRENVQIVMKFLGSGFGGKLWPWTQAMLAAVAARDLGRPVKLVIDRSMMFTCAGHRPRTQQRIRLGATPEGKLLSLEHDYANHSSMSKVGTYRENCGEATPFLYSTPNLRVRSAVVDRNVGTPTPMRGPGAVPGTYALESAMDEMAIKLKLDPVQFRLRNEPKLDESNGLPFSSRHLTECLAKGAEKFGWSAYKPEVGSMRKGDLVLGWGVACCTWPANRGACKATVLLRDDGTARIACATQDIGTGTYTVFAQVISERTGLPLHKIDVVLGNSSLPPGPTSGGSMVTSTVIPAILEATDAAIQQLLSVAESAPDLPFQKHKADELALTGGRVHLKSDPASAGVPFETILQRANIRSAEGEGNSGSSSSDPQIRKYSLHSFGAHFVEVEWDSGIARLRVSRVVTVIDVGQIVNLKAARNQVEGAIVMGVGMGLLERTIYDPRNGRPVNSNLADYLMATNADCPEIDVTFLDYPDKVLNEIGARGVGEIGLAGVAAAITSATYHATGVRVRELPIRLETLMEQEKRPAERPA